MQSQRYIRREMEGSVEAGPHDIENPYVVLENSLIEEVGRLSPISNSRCIYRVPNRLRHVSEDVYTPRVISIGPLHHGREALKAMEEHKKRYLQYVMGRSKFSLTDYIEKIKDREPKLRSCYSETIDLKSDELVRIILVDAIFAIEFLYRYWCRALLDENDCIFGKPMWVNDVWPDLVRLENQLPFFILEDLFDPDIFPVPLEYSNRLIGVERLSILFLSYHFVNDIAKDIGGVLDNVEMVYSSEEIDHFVDLLRKLYIAPINRESVETKIYTVPTIEELNRAGVKFKAGLTKNLFDIQFDDGILEIPKFVAHDATEFVLKNLVAFEQCTGLGNYLSDYVILMDQLVDTSKDAELLVKYKIIVNMLGGGNNELSDMINRLSNGVSQQNEFYFGTLLVDLNKFCSSTWHKRMANLRQNYFNTPWATISFFAAVLLLILTMIQTICSIISLT
ncbi:putative UPF0481 protein At3g02645 [Rosa chinensis]|uniref:putative UPF0481 protein At3g02645 n=1 Tax=Rosa chinensis TaxID=74649 RepID=UPI001AD91159|nr:putative UPF0481 protein At3g02645 [Rosa chinensis]